MQRWLIERPSCWGQREPVRHAGGFSKWFLSWMNGTRWPRSVLLCTLESRVYPPSLGVLGCMWGNLLQPVGCSRLCTRGDVVGWMPCIIMETVPWLHLNMPSAPISSPRWGLVKQGRRCVAAGEATIHKRRTPRRVKHARGDRSCCISHT